MDDLKKKYERRIDRARNARKEAEALLEQKSLQLYELNNKLQQQAYQLDDQIKLRTEELEIARDHAMAANKSKSTFLASMSHEIRTPMNGIIGMTNLLMEGALDKDQMRKVSVIKSSGESLLNIINDILDVSKLEAGKVELESRDFYLHPLIDSVTSAVAVSVADKDIELITLVHKLLPIEVNGDEIRIRQILINLIGNAIKFTNDGYVMLELSKVDKQDDRLWIRFEVHDTGQGISEENQKMLFQDFQQLQQSEYSGVEGTGLGLSICKRLATQLMDGEIGVESELGKGSTFWFELPFADHRQPFETRRPDTSFAVFHNRRILKAKYVSMVEGMGYQCDSIASIEEFIEISKDSEHSYLLLDVDFLSTKQRELILTEYENNKRLAARWIGLKSVKDMHLDATKIFDLCNAGEISKPFTQYKLARRIQSPDQSSMIMDFRTTGDLLIPETKSTKKILNILVAEDNLVNQMVIRSYLEKEGHTVTVANDGVEAVDEFQKNQYDVILMDIQMPRMDGVEATRKIKGRMEVTGQSVPVIALTANAMSGDREKFISQGLDDYLVKPIVVEDLYSMLEAYS